MERLGPYQIVRRLGAGGSAEVFLARGPTPKGDAELALKLILPHLADDGGHRAMLLREAKMVMPLRHPNVVEIYDVGEVDGRTYLALEYLPGWPLNVVIRALRDRKQALTLSEASHLVREAALGLHHAHEATDERGAALGIVHRDVSPHNLMLSREGHLKVVDFGLARATNASATMTGGLKGKLRYMPPEQLRSEPLDRRVDVFALGAILWDLALGQPLHPGPTEADIFQQALFAPQPHPDEISRGLPRAFVDVLQKAVARELPKRFATAQELADALAPFVSDDAAQKVAMLAAEALAAAEGAPRVSREDVPAWDAPPPTAGSDARAAAPSPRPSSKDQVPAWDAPPATSAPPSSSASQDPRVAPSLGKMPRVRAGAVQHGRRTTQPPAPSAAPLADALERDTIPVPPRRKPQRPAEADTDPRAPARDAVDEGSVTDAEALPLRRSVPSRLVPLVIVALLMGAGIVLVLRGFGVFGAATGDVPQPRPESMGTPAARADSANGASGAVGAAGSERVRETPAAENGGDATHRGSEATRGGTEAATERPARSGSDTTRGGTEAANERPTRGGTEPTRAGTETATERATRGGRATLVLTSDRPAVARTGTTDLGMTPITVTLPAGKHRIRLDSLDGQLRTTVDVNVPSSGTVQKHVVLAKP